MKRKKDKKIKKPKLKDKIINFKKFDTKKFKEIKTRIKDAKKTKKNFTKFDKLVQKKKNKFKTYSNFSIIKNGVINNYNIIDKEFFENNEELKKIKRHLKNENNFGKIEIYNERVKNLVKRNKILRKNVKKEKKVLKKEIKEINILNNNPKGQVLIDNKKEYVIEVKNVSKIYTSKSSIFLALKNINLKIKNGTFNVILGPSGSGKTTLLNIISGLDRVTKGEVIVNKVNIQSLTDFQTTLFRKEKIGFVFQTYNLLSSLNVRDNIEVGRSLQNNKNKRMNINDLLVDMNMENKKKKMIYELSGGQQQRVSIARALSKTPNILIGDEPTGALDQETSIKIFELFQKINKNNNTTIIIVTHNSNVAQLADLVIKVKDGEIEELIHNKKPLKANNLKDW